MTIRARAKLFGIRLAGVILGMLMIVGIGIAESADEVSVRTEETFVYDISFLFFRNAAEGSLTLRYLPELDLYEGVLRAKTKGLTGLLSLARKDSYRSLMRLSNDGNRLIPVRFSKQVSTWGYKTSSTTHMDYNLGVMWWDSTEETGGENTREIKSHPIPEGVVYEDFISAFFNLRRGVYGPIEPGRRYTLPALPTRQAFKKGGKKLQTFSVHVGRSKADGVARTLVSINVPKDLFGQRVGDIRFLLEENLVPSRILIENVLLFGDMKGRLRTHRAVKRQVATRFN